MNGNLKNEVIEVTEEGGWREWDTVCCVVLLLVAVAIVEIFYIENEEKKKINEKKNQRKWGRGKSMKGRTQKKVIQ